jgi:hypothetical protein
MYILDSSYVYSFVYDLPEGGIEELNYVGGTSQNNKC